LFIIIVQLITTQVLEIIERIKKYIYEKETINAWNILVRKLGKKQHGIPICRCKDNIKMDSRPIYFHVICIEMAHNRVQ
jgi:hypothetical protein